MIQGGAHNEGLRSPQSGAAPRSDVSVTSQKALATIKRDVRATIAERSAYTESEQAPAIRSLSQSQQELGKQLSALLNEMAQVSKIVEGLSLDPETSKNMDDARASLRRSRSKLVTIKGRLGRLRAFEQSHRLHPVPPLNTEMSEIATPTERADATLEKPSPEPQNTKSNPSGAGSSPTDSVG